MMYDVFFVICVATGVVCLYLLLQEIVCVGQVQCDQFERLIERLDKILSIVRNVRVVNAAGSSADERTNDNEVDIYAS